MPPDSWVDYAEAALVGAALAGLFVALILALSNGW